MRGELITYVTVWLHGRQTVVTRASTQTRTMNGAVEDNNEDWHSDNNKNNTATMEFYSPQINFRLVAYAALFPLPSSPSHDHHSLSFPVRARHALGLPPLTTTPLDLSRWYVHSNTDRGVVSDVEG